MNVPGQRRDGERERHADPPGPAEADLGRAARAEDADHVAGDPGHRHLRQRNHAAVPAEKGERQRDQAERQRLRPDLEGDERTRHPRKDEQRSEDGGVTQADGILEGPGSGLLARSDHDLPHRQAPGARVHRISPRGGAHGAPPELALRASPEGASARGTLIARLRSAARRSELRPCGTHAGRPRIPRGRNASTSTRITNVNTTLYVGA